MLLVRQIWHQCSKEHGGDVCIHTPGHMGKPTFHVDSQLEMVHMHLRFDNKSILVCGMYVPPDLPTAENPVFGDTEVTERWTRFAITTECVVLCAGDCGQYPV